VLDDQNNAYGELNNPIVVGNPEHAITESLVEGMVFSNAEALNFTTSQRLPGVTTESLARSASTSWVDKNENRTFDEGVETREASEVAVLSTLNPDGASSEVEEEPASEAEETEGSERETEAEETEGESASDEVEPVEPAQTALPEGTELSQVLVVGDVSFIRNASYDNYYNKDFALNAVNFLTARHDLISIRPNKPEDRPLNLQNWQRSVIFAFSVILTPLLIAGLGGLVWWKRS
jgi:ABC-type uncharacterized transport system involved in gliding motility auxiliary subunit